MSTHNLETEADVEIKRLFRLLNEKEYLSIPEINIKGKTYLSPTDLDKSSGKTYGYLPDFSVWVDALPLLIVEAKKPSVPVEVGFREATLYAHHLNKQFKTGLNPCALILASNGDRFLAGFWDSAPHIDVSWDEIAPGTSALQELRNFCSFAQLAASCQRLRPSLRPTKVYLPFNLIGGSSFLNARKSPNSFAAPLSPALIRYFTSQRQNTNPEVYEEAYVSSEEISTYDNVLSTLMRERIVEVRGSLSQNLKPSRKRELNLSKAISTFKDERPDGHLQLITGGVGTGKSLFIRRYKELLQTSEEKEASYWSFIDFNNAPRGLIEAENWLCESFISSFADENNYDAYNAENWPQVFSLELNRRKPVYDDIALSSREQAAMARANDLNTFISDPKRTAFGLTRHFLGERRSVVIVVMDNVDRLGTEEQLEVFRLSLWFMDQSRAFVILNLRDETYERYKDEKPLDTFKSGVTFHISQPPFAPILRRRIELSARYLARNTPDTLEYHVPSGLRFTYPNTLLGDFLKEIYVEIFEHQANSARLIQGLSGRDVREALIIFESILRSGHLSEDSITSKVVGGGEFEIKEDIVLRSLMRGDYKFHSDRSAYIKNILYCDPSWERPSNFIQPDILVWLYTRRHLLGQLGLEGYFHARQIIDDFQLRGYVDKDVLSCLNLLLKNGLIEADSFKKSLHSLDESVKITYSGFIHIRFLIGNLEYLYGILPTTPIFNDAAANRIIEILGREAVGRSISTNERLSAVTALLSHLENSFQNEVNSFPMFGGVDTGSYYVISEVRNLSERYSGKRLILNQANLLDRLE